ncbi:MAG: hypothetical protein Q7J48_10480 [Nocardioides sp.]|nr:hypothetical protein [Nocardioides sp.]
MATSTVARRLSIVSGVRSDDEIAERLAPYAEGDCLVAVDASLVVTNPTGNRPAEALLNAHFAPPSDRTTRISNPPDPDRRVRQGLSKG